MPSSTDAALCSFDAGDEAEIYRGDLCSLLGEGPSGAAREMASLENRFWVIAPIHVLAAQFLSTTYR
jgi:hypothetical protein